MSLEQIVKILPLPQGLKDKILAYLLNQPVKFNARFVQGFIAILAFVAVVFFDQDQVSTVGAAGAVIALIEKTSTSARDRVTPDSKKEALPIGGPGGDPSVPPIPLPEDLQVIPEEGAD